MDDAETFADGQWREALKQLNVDVSGNPADVVGRVVALVLNRDRVWRDEIAKHVPEINKMSFSGPSYTIKWAVARAAVRGAAKAHQFTQAEIEELRRFFDRWPQDMWVEGYQETVENILAARELAKLPGPTAEDMAAIRKAQAAGLFPPLPED